MTGKPSVAIMGAGLGGLCAGIKLKEAGINDITILEKAAKVGGTWRDNSYPGCCCDVPVALYQYLLRAVAAVGPSLPALQPSPEIHGRSRRQFRPPPAPEAE